METDLSFSYTITPHDYICWLKERLQNGPLYYKHLRTLFTIVIVFITTFSALDGLLHNNVSSFFFDIFIGFTFLLILLLLSVLFFFTPSLLRVALWLTSVSYYNSIHYNPTTIRWDTHACTIIYPDEQFLSSSTTIPLNSCTQIYTSPSYRMYVFTKITLLIPRHVTPELQQLFLDSCLLQNSSLISS